MSVNEEELEKLSLEEENSARLSIVEEENEEVKQEGDEEVDGHAANDGIASQQDQEDNQSVIKVDEDGVLVEHNVQAQKKKAKDNGLSLSCKDLHDEGGQIEEELEARQSSTCSPASLGFTEDQFTFIDEPLDETSCHLSCVLTQNLDDYRPHEFDGSEVIAETENEQDYPDTSDGRASELEGYNFLDESERSECPIRSDEEPIVDGKSGMKTDSREGGTTSVCSPKSEGRAKARAPLPPTGTHEDLSCQRSTTCTDSSCPGQRPLCPSAMVRYHQHHPHKIRFLQLSYNTNLKKPPENWLRMKHKHYGESGGSSRHHFGSSFWSYPFGKTNSWSMFSSFRYGSSQYGRNKRSPYGGYGKGSGHGGNSGMHGFDLTNCQCCGCCNCTQNNQTCCCCCYHCVHTISSCRRSDLMRLVTAPESPNGRLPGALPSILKKPKKLREKLRKRVAPEPGPEAEPSPVLAEKAEAVESDEPASDSQQKEVIKERGI